MAGCRRRGLLAAGHGGGGPPGAGGACSGSACRTQIRNITMTARNHDTFFVSYQGRAGKSVHRSCMRGPATWRAWHPRGCGHIALPPPPVRQAAGGRCHPHPQVRACAGAAAAARACRRDLRRHSVWALTVCAPAAALAATAAADPYNAVSPSQPGLPIFNTCPIVLVYVHVHDGLACLDFDFWTSQQRRERACWPLLPFTGDAPSNACHSSSSSSRASQPLPDGCRPGPSLFAAPLFRLHGCADSSRRSSAASGSSGPSCEQGPPLPCAAAATACVGLGADAGLIRPPPCPSGRAAPAEDAWKLRCRPLAAVSSMGLPWECGGGVPTPGRHLPSGCQNMGEPAAAAAAADRVAGLSSCACCDAPLGAAPRGAGSAAG